jgi:hypothetical protein
MLERRGFCTWVRCFKNNVNLCKFYLVGSVAAKERERGTKGFPSRLDSEVAFTLDVRAKGPRNPPSH